MMMSLALLRKIGYEKYDTVTCNPPYFPAHEASEKNLLEHVQLRDMKSG